MVLGDIGHILSLVFLIMAILVFLGNQSLLCGRVTVHINMFLSLICSNVCWLLWGHTILNDAGNKKSVLCVLSLVLASFQLFFEVPLELKYPF